MYTITHCWINDGVNIPEANCKVSGLYNSLNEARKGLHIWFMTVSNNGCELRRVTEDMYTFLSPDGKTRGCVEIQELK
jgi:hypothetical protein